jgi:hypothetical protein
MRVVCAFDDVERAEATVTRALWLYPADEGELFLLGGFRPPSWEPVGPGTPRRSASRTALAVALATAAERARRAGISARTAICPAECLGREALLQAAALGADRVVLAERARGFDRLVGRPPVVRTLRPSLRGPLGSTV